MLPPPGHAGAPRKRNHSECSGLLVVAVKQAGGRCRHIATVSRPALPGAYRTWLTTAGRPSTASRIQRISLAAARAGEWNQSSGRPLPARRYHFAPGFAGSLSHLAHHRWTPLHGEPHTARPPRGGEGGGVESIKREAAAGISLPFRARLRRGPIARGSPPLDAPPRRAAYNEAPSRRRGRGEWNQSSGRPLPAYRYRFAPWLRRGPIARGSPPLDAPPPRAAYSEAPSQRRGRGEWNQSSGRPLPAYRYRFAPGFAGGLFAPGYPPPGTNTPEAE